jgi:hypothetical protein
MGPTLAFIPRHRRRLGALAGLLGACSLLSGCLLTSPTWNQSFAHHTDAVPVTAWSTSTAHPVVFECTAAYHGGLYPPFGTPAWVQVAQVPPSGGALDAGGVTVYAASGSYVLPVPSCWQQDPANDVWYAAVRARQTGSAGPADGFFTVDAAGLECVGHWVGQTAHWLGWFGHNCQKTYSGSSTAIPYVIIHADA